MKFFLVICIFMLFVSQPAFSMNGQRYTTGIGVLVGEDLVDDEEQRKAIRRHNGRVIEQRIEMSESFWECCRKYLWCLWFCR
jgi:hypothetical protein